MKKRIITGFMFCFFVGVNLSFPSAQEYKKYDLSTYYTPDIVRNQLDISFSGNGNFNNNYSYNDSSLNSSIDGTLQPSFSTYKNTRNLISLFQLSGYFYGKSSKIINEIINNSQTSNESNNGLSLSYNVRQYNSGNKYFLLGISGYFGEEANMNHFETSLVKTKAGNRNYLGGLRSAVGFGFGRIESVEDARQAIYILDELSNKGVLTRQLTNDEVFQFSQQISRVKNKRFLDARLHLIDEISSVDSFFISNKLLTKSDASYFTTLYDYWQYGALFSRKSGHELEFRLNPVIYLGSDNKLLLDSVRWENSYINIYTGGATISYNYEKPVNLNWQHSARVELNCFRNWFERKVFPEESSDLTLIKSTQNTAQLDGRYSIKYYPNTRTSFEAGLSQLVNLSIMDDLKNTSTSQYKSYGSITNLNFIVNYYFSPQLRLTGSAGIGYYLGEYTLDLLSTYKNSNFRGGFSASINYSFF